LIVTGSEVISVNTSTDALRITQTGTGNALVVEDSANPDSTPFLIDNSGRIIQGYTGQIAGAVYNPANQIFSNTWDCGFGFFEYSNDVASSILQFNKTRATTPNGHVVVADGDRLGILQFAGSDGTNYIRGAEIVSVVDGTPGTNDMPGRLVFSTTADGASSPTERMRIPSTGGVGIGTTSIGGFSGTLNVGGSGSPASGIMAGIMSSVTAPATVTRLDAFYSVPNAAAATALVTLNHYFVSQGTIGAGATITNQIGYRVANTPIGATNNYGFYSEIPGGAGRWNIYIAGTADNFFQGPIKSNGTVAGGYFAHSAGTTAMLLGSYNVVKVTPNATATYTTTVAPAGAKSSIIIVTSGTTSYTITFGTGFLTTGTLATGTVTAKTFVVNFVSDGATMIETSRTIAM
jgi:hypothetical protein